MPGLDSTPRLKGYHVGPVIGSGAFSWVRAARETRTNAVVALKIFNTDLYSDSQAFLKQLRKEVSIHSKLMHENIIALREVLNEPPWVCMVLEMAVGGELFDKIAPDIGMDPELVHLYFSQLMAGVKYLHSIGVAHCDLKPENLLLDQDGNLKISDFGLSTVFMYNGKERMLTSRKGSMPYIAPEVNMSQPNYYARPADIWSCGIIMFALLFGNTPWDAADMSSPEFRTYLERPQLNYSPWSSLDEITKDLLGGLLAVNPNRRYSMSKIAKHPWVTQPNPLLVDGKCHDPIDVATRLLSKMTVSSQNDRTDQGVFQDEIISFSQPQALRAIRQEHTTGPTELNTHILFSQPVTRTMASQFVRDHEGHDFMATQAPSLTQVRANFADICGKTNLTRFFTDENTVTLVSRICAILDEMLITNRPPPSNIGDDDKQVDTRIVIKTMDRRKCPLEGDVFIMGPKTRGEGRLALVAFEKRRGCPIEWKRLYRVVSEQLGDLIIDKKSVRDPFVTIE